MNKSKLIQMAILLAAIAILAGGFLRMTQRNSMTLTDYQNLMASGDNSKGTDGSNGADSSRASDTSDGADSSRASDTSDSTDTPDGADSSDASDSTDTPDGSGADEQPATPASPLVGATLNAFSQEENRFTYAEGFYCEPVSDSLRRYITGISFPAPLAGTDASENGGEAAKQPEITVDELRYVHILHYDFDGDPTEGELICNEYIALDLLEIFYELYRNEYQLEKVLLIEEYEGDDTASMEDNNTSCFNYRPISGTTRLSKHSYGLAIDVNPFYNPYITYAGNGAEVISPAAASAYADRSASFPYKIDENDLCYKLFVQHGFTWGGNWNNSRDYQHFQKPKP